MKMKIILIYAACWLGMMVLAILNGIIREKVYGPFMRELFAHQLSTLFILILFSVYLWILTSIWKIESAGQALLIGGMWLLMTILFEFIFGHFVMGHPWSKLLHDYNFFKGRLWIVVLLWTAISPYLFYRIRL